MLPYADMATEKTKGEGMRKDTPGWTVLLSSHHVLIHLNPPLTSKIGGRDPYIQVLPCSAAQTWQWGDQEHGF